MVCFIQHLLRERRSDILFVLWTRHNDELLGLAETFFDDLIALVPLADLIVEGGKLRAQDRGAKIIHAPGMIGRLQPDGIERFQRAYGLTADGVMKPDGATAEALGTVLARRRRSSRSVGSDTDTRHKASNDAGDREGSYIWRTQGDSRVRSTHSDRDGKVFSWDNPPEGGHPGEAPNCRCWAEEIDCSKEEGRKAEIKDKQHSVSVKISNLETRIHNKKIDIEVDKADIEFYEAVNSIAMYGGHLGIIPHPLGRFAGFVFQVGEKISEGVLMEIRSSLAKNTAESVYSWGTY